jgi:hypothetical protein
MGEFLEVLLGPLAPINDHIWSRRPVAKLQRHRLRRLEVDAVEHGLYPCNQRFTLVLLDLHLSLELLELCLHIIPVFCSTTTTC